MLKKTRKTDAEPAVSPKPIVMSGKTVIGDQIFIEGAIRGKENLLIEGTVKGNIEVKDHHLTVGSQGQVEAEIHAANVTISGRVVGNIHVTGRVEITKEADFNGEIKARSIAVEDGAYLKAMIELEREPLKKVTPSGKPEKKEAPEPSKEPLILAGKAGKGN